MIIAALVLALAQTGVLTPPSGWVAAPPPQPHGAIIALGAWVRPLAGAHAQNIVLHQMPLSGKTPAAFEADRISSLKRVATDLSAHAEQLCGGTLSGWYAEYTVTLGDRSSRVEQTIAPGDGVVYTATYTRGKDEAEDAGARKALSTLCVR